MSYWEKVQSRLLNPGLAVLILGAVVGFASKTVANRFFPEHADRADIILKAAGCIAALIGALMLLEFI